MRSAFPPFLSVIPMLPALALVGGCRSLATPVPSAPGTAVAMGGSHTRDEARLDNGVRVVVEENHAAPVVAIQVWVAAGAADDPPGLAGAAHLFEHLVFRGTKRRPPGAAAREIEAVGGRVGAWTGLDQTVYHAVVAAPFLDLGLDVLADALAAPSFDPTELEQVRKQASEELARAQGDPTRRANAALFAVAFGDHPYGRPLLGTDAGIAARTRAELVARFGEVYVGPAVTVVVIGDIDAGAARAAVTRSFGPLPRSASGSPGAPALEGPPAAGVPRVSFATGPNRTPEILLGFRTPVCSAADAAALDLLAASLARVEASRFERELVRNGQVATTTRGMTFASRRGGLVSFGVTPSPRRIEEATRVALDEILRLSREDLPADEVESARAAVEGDQARGADRVTGFAGLEGHAHRLGFAVAITRNLDYPSRYQDQIRTLTPAELRAAAAKFLRTSALTILVVLPEATRPGRDETEVVLAPRLQAVAAQADTRAAAAQVAPPAPAVAGGDVVRFVAPSGVRVLVLRDTSAPLVTIRAVWAGGSQLEDPGTNGASALAASLLDHGTRTKSADEIDRRVRAMAGSLAGFSDRSAFGLRAEFLPRLWEPGLALVADCLRRPSFPEQEVDIARRALLDRIRADTQGLDAGPRAVTRLFQESLWPGHPNRFDPLGSPEAVSALTRVRVLDHYRRNYPLGRLVVAVVGDVDPRRVVAAANALFPAVPSSAPIAAPPPPPSRDEPVTVVRQVASDEAHVEIGYPTFGHADADRQAVDLLAEILGGEAGRLSGALRDDKALGLRASAWVPGRFDPGYLAVGFSCAPGQVDAAVAAVRAALARVAADGVTADEVTRAARRLMGVRALRLRGRGAIAEALAADEAFGLDLLAYRRYPSVLASLPPDKVTRAARRVLDPKREVIAVVRPAEESGRVATKNRQGGR